MNYDTLAVTLKLATSKASKTPDGLYRKELIYPGTFDHKGQFKFTVDDKLMRHWVATHELMASNGVRVPVPIDHSMSPEAKRGSLKKLAIEKNSRGIDALFGYIKFDKPEYETLAASADVSIYVPPEARDGLGNQYYRPIRHVGLTDYPVIPGLDGFEQIAASFNTGDLMNLKELAAKIGVTAEGTDEQICDAIAAAWQAKNAAPPAAPPAAPVAPAAPVMRQAMPFPRAPVAASLLGMFKENRQAKLDKLVMQGRITTAVAEKLSERYLSDDVATLALSTVEGDDGETIQFDDGFDHLMISLADNPPVVNLKSRTGTHVLPDAKKVEESSLVKNAEARKGKN